MVPKKRCSSHDTFDTEKPNCTRRKRQWRKKDNPGLSHLSEAPRWRPSPVLVGLMALGQKRRGQQIHIHPKYCAFWFEWLPKCPTTSFFLDADPGSDLAPGKIDCMFFKAEVDYIFEQQFSQIRKVFLAATCEGPARGWLIIGAPPAQWACDRSNTIWRHALSDLYV